MKFVKTHIIDPDNPGRKWEQRFWLSECGIYKIVEYFDTPDAPRRPIFYAYHKPIGWPNFGNNVDRTTQYPKYKTYRAAVKACKKHKAENPNGAYQ